MINTSDEANTENTINLKNGINSSPEGSNGSIKSNVSFVTREIGSGDDAHNSIVYRTIKYSFHAAAWISISVIFYKIGTQKEILIDEIKDIWAIFIPLITLALGYIFGKGK